MLRFFSRVDSTLPSSTDDIPIQVETIVEPTPIDSHGEQPEMGNADIVMPELPSDPGKRLKITEYDPNIRERVRRKYYSEGPCQPNLKSFPQRNIYGKMRRFNCSWYKEFPWLEYSISLDACFCLYCYLFKNELRHQGGGDTFVCDGFRNWKSKEKLRKHEGSVNSAHNHAHRKCVDLLNQNQHIETIFDKMTNEAKKEYKDRLTASIDCVRWLLKQGLAFRGHDESDGSKNQGNFLELLKFLASHNEEVRRVALKRAPKNLQLKAPCIQKDIVHVCAFETTKSIIEELGNGFFCILLDDSRDVSIKEQMAVVLRFVDKKGRVVERILGFKHVKSTTAISLKAALVDLLNLHGLSISMLRGQGYDGASNMRGEFNGLKALILRENESAYYVHCFAHQLQLALVNVARNHIRISEFFLRISNIVNVIGGSYKQMDSLREKQAERILDALENEEISSGRGLNQERTLIRPANTRWSSHYGTIMSLIHLFDSVIDVLNIVKVEGMNHNQKAEASRLIKDMQSYDFIFDLHLMKVVLGITNDLCKALQRKDQDIVNAMNLVSVSKARLQSMRDDGWDDLITCVADFCATHGVKELDMDDVYVNVNVNGKRTRQRSEEMTNSHRYRVEVFNTVLDMQLVELNGRFTETNTELLLCVACLNPSNSFQAFDVEKLVRLAKFYPKDFDDIDVMGLSDQLQNFVLDMKMSFEPSSFSGLGSLAEKMVESGRNIVYPLVYKLITLALLLPVSTAFVERAFSAMKIVKTRLRNRMSDDLMNDNLVVYIEKDMFEHVSNEAIIQKFQSMANRRGQL